MSRERFSLLNLFSAYILRSQISKSPSEGIFQSPLGERLIEPTFGPSGRQERLNCCVKALCGHGVGVEFHEEPQVDHYSSKEKGYLLIPGMIFTIEPMINQGTFDCIILEDKWTVVTKDKKLSAQWENTVLVTETGIEILAK